MAPTQSDPKRRFTERSLQSVRGSTSNMRSMTGVPLAMASTANVDATLMQRSAWGREFARLLIEHLLSRYYYYGAPRPPVKAIVKWLKQQAATETTPFL